MDSRLDLQEVVQRDFDRAEDEALAKDAPHARRNGVRCFGSFADALASTLREMASDLSILFEKPVNAFLKDKANERGATAMYRIQSYRIVGQLMPTCRLANVEQSIWDRLQRALEVRNRVMHPTKIEDLTVTENEVKLMSDLATQIMKDLAALFHLCKIKVQETMWKAGAPRVRSEEKLHRNDICVCGSGKKYKHCCGRNLPSS